MSRASQQDRARNTNSAANIAIRAAAISMGFVFFAGGWRRFFNMPAKLDITSPKHLSNKLVEAAPGSPVETAIHWVLHHPFIAEWSVYLMSAAEIVVGAGLILGLFTRFAALGAAGVNIALMLIFGWEGYECLDEWTMAALGFAVSVTVMFAEPGRASIDGWLHRDWLSEYFTPRWAALWTIASVLFTIGFYSYFFGFFDFQRRTSVAAYSIVAEQVAGHPDVERLYVNGGASPRGAYVKGIRYTLKNGETVYQPADKIQVVKNVFAPWAQSGVHVDGVLKLTLGSKVDIRVPQGAESANINIIDNKDVKVVFGS